jgi:hypothetical protein
MAIAVLNVIKKLNIFGKILDERPLALPFLGSYLGELA